MDTRISSRLYSAIDDALRDRVRDLGLDLDLAPVGSVVIAVDDLRELAQHIGCAAAVRWQDLIREHAEDRSG